MNTKAPDLYCVDRNMASHVCNSLASYEVVLGLLVKTSFYSFAVAVSVSRVTFRFSFSNGISQSAVSGISCREPNTQTCSHSHLYRPI